MQFNVGSDVLENVSARDSGLGGLDFHGAGGNTLANVSAVDGESRTSSSGSRTTR